tara:strand:+ start:914 stop:1102 length:189 start_codon:yes stop_codon:yes gene_type:complete
MARDETAGKHARWRGGETRMTTEAAEILHAVAQFVDRELLAKFDPEMSERLSAWRRNAEALA